MTDETVEETIYFDDFIKTSPLYWAISGYSDNIDDIMKIVKTVNALRVASMPEPSDMSASTKIDAVTVDFPHTAKEALRQELEAAIFRDAQVVNTQAILAGRILVGAVEMAGASEDNKAKNMERHATKFIRGLMNIVGLEGNIKFTHKTLKDDEAVMRMLTMASNWHDGPLLEELVRAAPPFQGRVEEVIKAIKVHEGIYESGSPAVDDDGQVN